MAKYSKSSQKSVGDAMHEMKKGKLTIGKSGKKVTNPKQAVAIGLSEAREKGARVPEKSSSKSTSKKSSPKKSSPKESSPKKSASKKSGW